MLQTNSNPRWFTRAAGVLVGACAVVLLCPDAALAYVGPGAGFAVLSSFLTLLLAFFYSLIALLTWPVRQLWRMVRRRRAYRSARVKRVVVVGFDGMDPELAGRWMDEGKLPNLAGLRAAGTFRSLATTFPPISPVAWSTFLTGVNPGKHNIYDFLARDTNTYLPYLSSAQIREPKRSLKLGKLTIPLGRPQLKALRKGKPFWHFLGEAGIFSSVIRVPITFPPEKFSGVLLSGMCVPDLRGSQGTFCYFSESGNGGKFEEGGVRIPFERNGSGFRAYLPGPENPVRSGAKELRVPFTVRPDAARRLATLELDGRKVTLKQGEYSEWIDVVFRAAWGVKAHGICRFYLKEVAPRVELYATPVNIDPRRPALPISHPFTYSVYLGKLHGPYATLGLAEDTWALNEHVLDDAAFLEQCYLIHAERERQFFDALEKTSRGVCVCVFDITDRVQHMFWRHTVPGHPAAAANPASASAGGSPPGQVIEQLYHRMDELVGRVVRQLGDDTLLLVLSDHGFKSFERGFNLNAWLWQHGYLALKDGAKESREWLADADWSRTRAFGLGLNGLYVNQRGREREGIVTPGEESSALKKELIEKLRGLVDAQSGRVGIRDVFDRDAVYGGPYTENSPDLILGYAPGYRASWETVMGKVTGFAFEDNRKAWSGDHCIDPLAVPGVLFSNWKIRAEQPAIADVAPTLLDLFGLPLPAHFDGLPWEMERPERKGPSS